MKHITGVWTDAKGNMAAFGKLHLKLNQDAVIIGTNQVAPREVEFQLSQIGALPAGSTVWANDELSPAGTYYTAVVTAFGGGVIWGPQWFVLSGEDPINLTAINPILTIPPVDQQSTLSVVTSPTLVGGALGASITGPNGVSTNLVTASDQLIFAPGPNISIQGSFSQQSLTLSISGRNPPLLGAEDQTANGLMLYGGSNVTLVTASDSLGISASINAPDPTVTHPLMLFEGSNITLQSAINGGTSYTINAPHGGGGGGEGGEMLLVPGTNVGITQNSDGFGTTATISAAGGGGGGETTVISNPPFLGGANGVTVSNQLMLTGGSNISLSQATNANGMTVTISGIPQTSLTSQFTSITNSASLFRQVSIVSSGALGLTTNSNSLGSTFTISAPFGDTGTGGENPVFTAGANGQTVTNQIMLTGGSNISLQTTSNASGMTVSISASAQTSLTSQFTSLTNATTMTTGLTSLTTALTSWTGNLSLVGGPNITLASTSGSSPFGTTVTIAGGAGGTQTGGGAGSVSLVSSAGAGVTQTTNAFGSTFTVSAPYTTQLTSLTSQFTSLTNSASLFRQVSLVAQGGISTTLATNTIGSTFTISGITGGGGGGPSFSAGANGQTVSNQLMLTGGSNISLQTATNANGMTVTVSALAQTTLTSGITSVITSYVNSMTSNVTTVTTALASVTSLTSVGRPMVLSAGDNIMVGSTTNTMGTTWGITGLGGGTGGGGTTTIISNPPFIGGANGQTVSNQLMLTGGANISLQTATNINGMTVTVSGIAQTTLTSGISSYITSLVTSLTSGVTTLTTGMTSLTSQFTSLTNTTGLTSLGRGLSLVTGNTNITIQQTTNSAGTTASIFGPAPGATGGGGTTISNPVISLVQGSNITLSYNASTYTVSAIAQTGLTTGLTTMGSWTASSAAWNAAAGGASPISISGINLTVTPPSGTAFTVSSPLATNVTTMGSWTASSGNWNTAGSWSASSGNWNTAGNWSASSANWNSAGSWTASSGNWNTAGNWSLSSSAWNTAGNWSLSSSSWNAGGGAGAGFGSRYFMPAMPLIPSYTTWSSLFPTAAQSVVFWPLNPMQPSSRCSAAYIFWRFSWAANFSGTATAAGTINLNLGFYSRNQSTLTRLSSGGSTYQFTVTAQGNLTNYNQLKVMKMTFPSLSFDGRDYWAGFCWTTGSAGNAYSFEQVCVEGGMSGAVAGEFGVATNSTWQRVPFWGMMTNVNTLPTSVVMSQVIGTSATMCRVPVMWLGGFTG